MSSFSIYLILMLDSICILFITSCIVLFMSFMFLIFLENIGDLPDGVFKKWFIPNLVGFLLLSLMSTFTPTTKQAALIYAIPKITENENVNKIPDKLLKLADDWIEELSPKGENND